MKTLKTFILLTPLSLLSQNPLFSNLSNQINVVQAYNNDNNNNNVIFNNVHPNANPAFLNAGPNSKNNNVNKTTTNNKVAVVPRRNVNRTVSQNRNQNRTNVVRRPNVRSHNNPQVQTQQTVALPVVQNGNQNVVQANTDNNFGENNVKINPPAVIIESNVNINDNNIQEQTQQVTVVQQPIQQKKEAEEGNGLSIPKINLPKMNFGGRDKVSSASSHHVNKHLLKKFFLKQTRKHAAKHSGKRKKICLDGCFNWLIGK